MFYVDDNMTNRDLATGLIWQAGYDLAEAATALAGRRLLDGGLRPDVMVLNLDMHGAWELWDHRQESPALRELPVVVLASFARPGSVGDAIVVNTPIAPATFLATLQQLVSPGASR